MPGAAANTTAPRSALMSMPRCQPDRRRPNVDVTGPSMGHAKSGDRSTKSGTKSMRLRGPQQRGTPRASRGAASTRGPRGAGGVDASAWLGRAVTLGFAVTAAAAGVLAAAAGVLAAAAGVLAAAALGTVR